VALFLFCGHRIVAQPGRRGLLPDVVGQKPAVFGDRQHMRSLVVRIHERKDLPVSMPSGVEHRVANATADEIVRDLPVSMPSGVEHW
jgi:hypothetical protein